ncbi:hypothetical protein [Pyrococcus kukulkanii]|uniref:hypothetical protein n=1 Tax=Pyrococcus kukulkanii TaxID=1609559 RepID=UPI00356A2DA5
MPAPRCENGLARGITIVLVSYITALMLQILETMREGLGGISFGLFDEYMRLFIVLILVLGILDAISTGLKAKYWPTDYAVCLIFALLFAAALIKYLDFGFIIIILLVIFWLWRRFNRPPSYYRW